MPGLHAQPTEAAFHEGAGLRKDGHVKEPRRKRGTAIPNTHTFACSTPMKRYQPLHSTENARPTTLVFDTPASRAWEDASEFALTQPVTTLHDYRLAHPRTAEVPTMTQGLWLGAVLASRQRRLAREARRRALVRQVLSAPGRALTATWTWLQNTLHPATPALAALPVMAKPVPTALRRRHA